MVDLRKVRINAKLTQTELAARAGISQQAVGMIETGKRKPSARSAIKIAKVLGFDWTEFFSDDKEDPQ